MLPLEMKSSSSKNLGNKFEKHSSGIEPYRGGKMDLKKTSVSMLVLLFNSWVCASDDQSYFFKQGSLKWSYTQTYEVADGCVFPDPQENVGGFFCFEGGTLVDTPKGSLPIMSIRVGDVVYSYDLKMGKRVQAIVTGTQQKFLAKTCELTTRENKKIRVVPAHNFFKFDALIFTSNESRFGTRWSRIGSGTGVLARYANRTVTYPLKGELVPLSALSFKSPMLAPVFNLTVEPNNNYFVDGILVHNLK